MNRIAIAIKNNLSLRPPQADSLNILANLADKLSLTKAPILNKKGFKGGGEFLRSQIVTFGEMRKSA